MSHLTVSHTRQPVLAYRCYLKDHVYLALKLTNDYPKEVRLILFQDLPISAADVCLVPTGDEPPSWYDMSRHGM